MPFQRRSICGETPKFSATLSTVSPAMNFVARDAAGVGRGIGRRMLAGSDRNHQLGVGFELGAPSR